MVLQKYHQIMNSLRINDVEDKVSHNIRSINAAFTDFDLMIISSSQQIST